MRRNRNIKIIATLGPASAGPEIIRALFKAGADVFRINMSHTSHDQLRDLRAVVRSIEDELDRPIGILVDLQGPKIRVGEFAGGSVELAAGDEVSLGESVESAQAAVIPIPHPEIFAAMEPGMDLLFDDGRIRMRVTEVDREKGKAKAVVTVPGKLSDHKGVNIPGAVLPLAAMTDKDRRDLAHAVNLGIDWIALSFVQRPEDIAEARRLVGARAAILAKIEKPAAVDRLEAILELADAVMVARGDLGVELPVEDVPGVQKRIIQAAHLAGKPVVVATQMLESMITSPMPTRAEVSDVATAIYDGADAIMLSAESATGDYPVEAVTVMNRVAEKTECEPTYASSTEAHRVPPEATTSDAISRAARQVAETLSAAAIVNYTTSGSTGLRSARERPRTPILALTPRADTARRLALAWGLHCVRTEDATSFPNMIEKACQIAREENFAKPGDRIVITAGVPFGTPGSTNVLRIAHVPPLTQRRAK